MNEILAIGMQAMHVDMQKLDRISLNLANATMSGYKREMVISGKLNSSHTSFEAAVDNLSAAKMNPQTPSPLAARLPLIQVDSRPGTLKSTGQSLDLAIAGNGYFEIATDTGPAYTRQGNFKLDARGRLVNTQGWPVMGNSGEIFLGNSSPVINSTGQVFETGSGNDASTNQANSQPIAQIKVVEFENPKNLRRIGDGLLESSENSTVMKDTDLAVRQGFLENSNVTSMDEMVNLIQTMRHFEAIQKAVMGYDDMTGQAIRKLSELT